MKLACLTLTYLLFTPTWVVGQVVNWLGSHGFSYPTTTTSYTALARSRNWAFWRDDTGAIIRWRPNLAPTGTDVPSRRPVRILADASSLTVQETDSVFIETNLFRFANYYAYNSGTRVALFGSPVMDSLLVSNPLIVDDHMLYYKSPILGKSDKTIRLYTRELPYAEKAVDSLMVGGFAAALDPFDGEHYAYIKRANFLPIRSQFITNAADSVQVFDLQYQENTQVVMSDGHIYYLDTHEQRIYYSLKGATPQSITGILSFNPQLGRVDVAMKAYKNRLVYLLRQGNSDSFTVHLVVKGAGNSTTNTVVDSNAIFSNQQPYITEFDIDSNYVVYTKRLVKKGPNRPYLYSHSTNTSTPLNVDVSSLCLFRNTVLLDAPPQGRGVGYIDLSNYPMNFTASEAAFAPKFRIYPNPASSILTIESENNAAAIGNVEWVNAIGQSIALPAMVSNSSSTYDVSSLTPGVYILRVQGMSAGRVLIER
jgi:hypothetical protein